MPQFDKTGPLGKGPKTGRGLGSCASDSKAKTKTTRKKTIKKSPKK